MYSVIYLPSLKLFLDDDPKGGPDADCIHNGVLEEVRKQCHGKVSTSKMDVN